MFEERRRTQVMARQCLQKLMYFLSFLGCFRTTLVIAAYAGNVNVLRLLLQHGVDLFHRNKHGFDDLGNRRQFKPE